MANYWLFKSEPNTFSYDDLLKSPGQTTIWEGVRNYQARNLLRDACKVGDKVLFYHSRVAPISVVGTCEIVKSAHPDPTQFDPDSPYFDEKSTPDNPRWVVVDVKAVEKFEQPVTREEMKQMPDLDEMVLLRKGSRLSIQPVTAAQWKSVIKRAKQKRTRSAG